MVVTKAGLGFSHEPRTPSESPTWVVWAQVLETSFAAFQIHQQEVGLEAEQLELALIWDAKTARGGLTPGATKLNLRQHFNHFLQGRKSNPRGAHGAPELSGDLPKQAVEGWLHLSLTWASRQLHSSAAEGPTPFSNGMHLLNIAPALGLGSLVC